MIWLKGGTGQRVIYVGGQMCNFTNSGSTETFDFSAISPRVGDIVMVGAPQVNTNTTVSIQSGSLTEVTGNGMCWVREIESGDDTLSLNGNSDNNGAFALMLFRKAGVPTNAEDDDNGSPALSMEATSMSVIGLADQDGTTLSVPSGYTEAVSGSHEGKFNITAYRRIAITGTETPGSWGGAVVQDDGWTCEVPRG